MTLWSEGLYPVAHGHQYDPFMTAHRSLQHFRVLLFIFVAGGLVLTGCRTYGGYGSEEKTYHQIQETIRQLEQELGRAQSDLRRLETAADTVDALKPLADRYRELVASHEGYLQTYRGQAEALSAGASYRNLHRTYGAMITDRDLLHRQYTRTVRVVWATVRNVDVPRKTTLSSSMYSTTPVGFPRVRFRGPITMAEALQAVAVESGVQREESGA